MVNQSNTVAIIIPMYNAQQTILRTIQSVLDQTWRDWRIYLINDCSTDNSLYLVREYCRDPRITIIDNEINLGAAKTRNVGLNEAREQIIAFLEVMMSGIKTN